MKTLGRISVLVVVSAAVAQAQANPQILKQLDDASAKFHHVQANVEFDTYTKAVKEHDISKGTMYVERQGSSENMAASVADAGSPNSAKILNYGGGLLQIYSPGTKQVDIFKAGANQAKYESFLTLGFGGSGKDLERDWTIQDQGPETIGGVKTEKLDLVGKDQGVRNMFSHITIWVDPSRGISVKQIFFQPDGDSRTAVYSNINLKDPINKKLFAIDPKANKVQH